MEGNGDDVPISAKLYSWPSLFSASFYLFSFHLSDTTSTCCYFPETLKPGCRMRIPLWYPLAGLYTQPLLHRQAPPPPPPQSLTSPEGDSCSEKYPLSTFEKFVTILLLF